MRRGGEREKRYNKHRGKGETRGCIEREGEHINFTCSIMSQVMLPVTIKENLGSRVKTVFSFFV